MKAKRCPKGVHTTEYRPYRNIHCVNEVGDIVKVVRAIHYVEADRLGFEYVHDWRQAFINAKLHTGDYMCCDDGWIVRVVNLSYSRYWIELETGMWKISWIKVHRGATNFLKRSPTLDKEFIVSNPAFPKERQTRFSVKSDFNILKMRIMARRYLENGFDIDEAWTHTFKHPRSGKTDATIERSTAWRLAVSSEAKRYYEESGVTVGRILNVLMVRAERDGTPNSEALEICKVLLRHHPEMTPNDLEGVKGAGAAPNRIRAWLGDADFVQDGNVLPPPQDVPQLQHPAEAPAPAAAAITAPPEPTTLEETPSE